MKDNEDNSKFISELEAACWAIYKKAGFDPHIPEYEQSIPFRVNIGHRDEYLNLFPFFQAKTSKEVEPEVSSQSLHTRKKIL